MGRVVVIAVIVFVLWALAQEDQSPGNYPTPPQDPDTPATGGGSYELD